MKMIIVVHSYTGNTNLVAEKVAERLKIDGHSVELHRLKLPEGWKPGDGSISFESLPHLDEYDAVVFGSPVEAFSLSPAMKRYFSNVDSLVGKKVGLLVTHQFPWAFLGGSRALRQMEHICEDKGGDIVSNRVIDWSNRKRDQQIEECVSSISEAFKK